MNYIQTLQNEISAIALGAVAALPSIAIGIFVLFLTWVVSKFAGRLANRITRNASIRESLKQLTQTLVRLGIWVGGIMLAMAVALPDLSAGNLVAGLGVGALAIGFAFQDIFENFLAGVLIMVRDKMHIGDAIDCNGIIGKVERITLRETHIRQFSNELTIMPNSMLFKDSVKILTDQPVRRDELVVGVAYDTDLDLAKSVITDCLAKLTLVEKDRPIEVLADSFNASSVDFVVRWWTSTEPQTLPESKDIVVRAIKAALDNAKIDIPFPHITHNFNGPIPFRNSAADIK